MASTSRGPETRPSLAARQRAGAGEGGRPRLTSSGPGVRAWYSIAVYAGGPGKNVGS